MPSGAADWAYYSEHDGFAAAWLRRLIDRGLIAPGVVDERSIEEVQPEDVRPFRRVHLFAGIGGWDLALRWGGWPDESPVWTGSCPCQPLSIAGRGLGAADERHLWPAFWRLLSECRPPTVFGEQVASARGRDWFAAVRADCEQLGYRVGAADLPAACAPAPHSRQRLFWCGMGDAARDDERRRGESRSGSGWAREAGGPGAGPGGGSVGDHIGPGLEGLARDVDGRNESGRLPEAEDRPVGPPGWDGARWVECTGGKARLVEPGFFPVAPRLPGHVARLRAIGNTIVPQVGAVFVRAMREAIR